MNKNEKLKLAYLDFISDELLHNTPSIFISCKFCTFNHMECPYQGKTPPPQCDYELSFDAYSRIIDVIWSIYEKN